MRGIVASSLVLSKSSEKISDTIYHSFSNSFPMRRVVRVGDVSLMKLQRSMLSISSLVSISKFSSVTFVTAESS